jgi:hypothetical protein
VRFNLKFYTKSFEASLIFDRIVPTPNLHEIQDGAYKFS